MANVAQYSQVMLLDYMNLGSVTKTPTKWAIALSTGSPTSLASFVGEPGTASGYARQTMSWSAAAGTPATAFNAIAATFGPFSTLATFSGVGCIDSIATPGIGNQLWYGLLATARIVQVGDQITIPVNGLTCQVS